jgi:hypothetical protein
MTRSIRLSVPLPIAIGDAKHIGAHQLRASTAPARVSLCRRPTPLITTRVTEAPSPQIANLVNDNVLYVARTSQVSES